MKKRCLALVVVVSAFGVFAATPDFAVVEYAPADPPGTSGHLLDIYLPAERSAPAPVVLWTAGSAWLMDNGRTRADWIVQMLVPRGYAVVGVSVRSSGQAPFPAQLDDIKAAIRYVRANAADYGFDPANIGVIGTSSGGWVAAMAATTLGRRELEGGIGTTGVSSAVNAAVAFWPPTDFRSMDAWALEPCERMSFRGRQGFCHDDPDSPESRLVGCAIQECPDKAMAANPISYVSADSAPIFILHGQSDPLVPHHQGESLYQAYNKACGDATFISVPKLGHGPLENLADADVTDGATRRTTTSSECAVENPAPFRGITAAINDFLDRHLKARR